MLRFFQGAALIYLAASQISKTFAGARRFAIPAVLFSALFSAAALCGDARADDIPPHIGRRVNSPDDTRAIEKVIEDFGLAIRTKNPRLLSTLLLNSSILFDTPAPPEVIANVREKTDVTFNGIRTSGYRDFAAFLGTTKSDVEEKFYNIKITQDRNVAWVMFDYMFLVDGKAQNYGVEAWQMMKVLSNEWKIVSVVWTMNRVQEIDGKH